MELGVEIWQLWFEAVGVSFGATGVEVVRVGVTCGVVLRLLVRICQ